MQTGILGGFITGSILSAVVLGAVSVATYPVATAPEAAAVDVPAGSEFNQSREDTQASLPDADQSPEAAASVPVVAPEPDDLSSLQGADIAPAQAPDAGAAEAELSAPDAVNGNVDVELDRDEPVLPSPQALPPRAPESESDLSISTEPAQPLQPEITTPQSAFDADTGEAATPVPLPTPAPEVIPEEAPETEQDAEIEPVSEPQDSAVVVIDPPAEPDAPTGIADQVVEPETADVVALPVEPEEPVETTGSTIGNLAQGVTTDRLPVIGSQNAPDAGTDAGAAEAETAPDANAEEEARGPEDLPRLEAHAAAFENPEGKPLMAIVLIDEGSSPISLDALADFPYPISYAVDASWDGAGEAARRYRDAGLEVLAMVDLLENASATDTEVAMQTYLSAIPQSVAVMEGTGTGLQASREAAQQLIPILRDSGHGLVLFPNGLNTVQKLIAREGVPALTVFRDFDSKGQDARAIRRFLDQAAFRAGQEDMGVIMVGRLRAETVSALLLWGLQDRANSVAIAPVSALLKKQIAP